MTGPARPSSQVSACAACGRSTGSGPTLRCAFCPKNDGARDLMAALRASLIAATNLNSPPVENVAEGDDQ